MALVGVLAAAATGFSIFFWLAWSAVDVRRTEPAEAVRGMDAARRAFSRPPLFSLDGGRLQRREAPQAATTDAPLAAKLIVLAYRVDEQGLVRADVPCCWRTSPDRTATGCWSGPSNEALQPVAQPGHQLEPSGDARRIARAVRPVPPSGPSLRGIVDPSGLPMARETAWPMY